MVEAEPAIRQLLKLDFEPKVSTTIRRNFRQTINQTIKTQLLPMAQQQAEKILQYYPQARAFLEQTLEQEAITKIALNQKLQLEVKEKIKQYNQSVNGLNECLRSLQLSDHQLPVIDREIAINIEPKTQISNNDNGDHSHLDSITVTTDM